MFSDNDIINNDDIIYNDDDIIKNILTGDKDSFKHLVLKYQNLIFTICFNIVKDPHEAENLAQETFIQAYKSLHQYEFKGFKAWLGKIASHKSIDWKRRNALKPKTEVIYLDEVANSVVENSDSVEDFIIKKDDKDKLLKLCNTLPEIYSKVIDMYYFQSKSYKEIALEENITVKTVESRLYRGKKILKEQLKEDFRDAF